MASLLSKIPIIKRYIDLDPDHPGTVSKQRNVNKNGKKSRIYWLWQTSFQGEKKSERIPDNEVARVKELIASAKASRKAEDKKKISLMKVYDKIRSDIVIRNRKIRKRKSEMEAKAKKKDDDKQKDK